MIIIIVALLQKSVIINYVYAFLVVVNKQCVI